MVRIIENYTLYEMIGEGAYGKVYRAINKVDNKEYAVKVIEVKKFQTNKKLEECTVHEINILANIQKNPHIICYYDMLKTQNNFYFVYEYCNGGTLEGLLRKQQSLDEKRALIILRQLLQAFKVLNKYNIMHRDLKPDNIFFHNLVLKVGDFGFSKSLEKAQMTKTMLGSPIYMAPQILNGQIYSNKADIWSIGVVLYEMLYGYCPFQSNSIPKLIEVLKETQLDFPNDVPVSNQTKKLMRRILTKDPLKRIQWMQLFQIQISPQGKLIEQSIGKLTLGGNNKDLMKSVRQITDVSDDPTSSSSYKNSYQSFNSYSSPKNYHPTTVVDPINKSQKSDEKPKMMPFMRKQQPAIEQVQTINMNVNNSPVKRTKTQGNGVLKDTVTKFHQEIIKGINIGRCMGLNNEKHTPLFSLLIFKSASQKLKKFKDQELQNTQCLETKQFRSIIEQEIQQIDYQIAMLKSKVQDFPHWKKAVKAKVLQFRNIRLCYELVMFLSGEQSNQNITHNEMNYMIRTKTS